MIFINAISHTYVFLLGVDSISNMSSTSEVLESLSVVTPGLASSVCLMLSNLVVLEPKDAFRCIVQQGIFKSLLRYLLRLNCCLACVFGITVLILLLSFFE